MKSNMPIGISRRNFVKAMAFAAMVLATAAGPGLTGTLIDGGIALTTQMKFMGAYCLLTAGAMTFAATVLGRRAARERSVGY